MSPKYIIQNNAKVVRFDPNNKGRGVYYRDGTTHVILAFTAKLAALIHKPRVNLTRFHDVVAPSSKHRMDVTLAW